MKNKRIKLSTLLLLWMSIALNAAPLTREQARLRAMEFLKDVRGSRQLVPVQNAAKLAPRRAKATLDAQQELYYVFNRGESEGFVIVSGDDRTLPVLGYTDNGEFDYNDLPDNMRWWLDGHEQELLMLSQNPMAAPAPDADYPVHAPIAPMLTTKWNQNSPYDQECPEDEFGNMPVGCVAVAMAQVLYYHRNRSVNEIQKNIPSYISGLHSYEIEGIEAGAPIDWDNMLDEYNERSTEAQKLAVAQLMHYCGVSVEMDYSNWFMSCAFIGQIPNALQNYFGYSSQTRYASGIAYNWEAWDNLLYNELAQGRPFIMGGDLALNGNRNGHAFVCDGYDGNYCYHVNWGWGGNKDGYFLLNSMNPDTPGTEGAEVGYLYNRCVVVGCEPERYSAKTVNATMNIGPAHSATFIAPFDVEIPDNVTAYTVSGTNGNTLQMEELTENIPANTPVILHSDEEINLTMSGMKETPRTVYTYGLLTGIYTDKVAPVNSYVLQSQNNEVAFYRVEEGAQPIVTANHVYLTVPSENASNVKAYRLDIGDDATAIKGLESKQEDKTVIYDMTGRRVEKAIKGMYIINGEKVIVK